LSGVYFMRDRSRAKTAANGWAAGIPGRRGPERVCPEPQRHQSQTVPLIRTRWRRFQDPCPGCSFRPPPDRSRAKTAANGWAAGIPGRRGPERVCPEPRRHQSQTVPLIRTRWRRFQDPCPGCSFRPPPDQSRAKTAANGWAAGIPGRRGPERVCPEPPRHQSPTVPLIRARWRRENGR
jgi:hypothetical protein